MSKIIPHWYQDEAASSIFNYFESGGKGNPLVAMPTGTGKSIVIAEFLIRVFRQFPNQRVLLLTHVWKLIEQNAEKIQAMWPTVPLGIHSAGLGQRQTMLPIIYGGVQSVCPTLEKNNWAFGPIDLIIIDEAHLLGSDEDSQYLKVIQILTAINPYLKVIGLTATPFRLKMGMLTDGGLFSDICYNLCTYEAFQRLIKEGFLCPLIGKPTDTIFEGIRELSLQAGDFNQKQAEDLIEKQEDKLYSACQELLDYGYNRNKCMVFAAGIKNAEHIASLLDSFGASATFVHSKLSATENKKRLEAYSAGEYWAVVGANMLTTGYDEPQIDLIADFQTTCSPGKHVQKNGRGTRVLRDWMRWRNTPKENCLVLDFVGNIGANGPIDDPIMPRKPGQKTGEPPPIKICESVKLKANEGKKRDEWTAEGCGAYNHASVRYCCNCAAEFSFKQHVEATAYNDSPMKVLEPPQLEVIQINRPIFFSKHNGKETQFGNKPPTIKALYPFNSKSIPHYLCFEHTGKARRLAHEWWMKHAQTDPPKTCDEFLERRDELRTPKSILVHVNLKWPEIKQWDF